jgi:hypothetical protein
VMRQIVREMTTARRRSDIERLNEALPARHPGELINLISRRLSDRLGIVRSSAQVPPSFKFFLDDCEVLSPLQQKSVNTLVRMSRSPVSWVISAVGALFDSTKTFIEQQHLTDADRRVISLDERDDKDFSEICQAVVSLRLLFSVSEGVRISHRSRPVLEFFKLGVRFGHRTVNEIMAIMASSSTSMVAQQLRAAAERFQGEVRTRTNRAQSGAEEALPLYETYLLLLWEGKEDSFKCSFEPDDVNKLSKYVEIFDSSQMSAWLRRKQRGALLRFGARLGFRRLPLPGEEIILSLSDGTIRDFLEILGEIYELYARRHRLDVADQNTLDKFAASGTKIAITHPLAMGRDL